MQKTVRFSVATTIIPAWLFAFAILIFAAHFDGTQAQDTTKKDQAASALTCSKVFKDRCNDMAGRGGDRHVLPIT